MFAAVLLLGTFFSVFSQTNKDYYENKGDCEQKCKISNVLNLTSRQKAELGKLKSINYSQDAAYFAKLQNLRVKLIRESAKQNPNSEELNKVCAEIGQCNTELAAHFSMRIREMKNILTDEQFEKFVEYSKNKMFGDFNKIDRQK
jgi:Spy/CpxP family protein refolding chaperone